MSPSSVAALPGFAPAVDMDDEFLVQQERRAEQSTQRILDTLSTQFTGPAADTARWAADVLSRLSTFERGRALRHPFHHQWRLLALGALRDGDRERVAASVHHLPRLLLHAAAAAALDTHPVPVAVHPPATAGASGPELRLAGSCAHHRLAAPGLPASASTVNVHLAHGELVFADDDVTAERVGHEHAVIADELVEIDASDPWVVGYLDALNAEPSPPPYPSRDLAPAVPLTEPSRDVLGQAFALIVSAWPEMATELANHVRLVVPFRGTAMVGWTPLTQLGAIYVRALSPGERALSSDSDMAVDPVLFTAERIVHEAGHTRLHTMTLEPLHHNDRGELIGSPLRRDRRPVSGVYHATFVLARVIGLLRRVAEVAPSAEVSARLAALCPRFDEGVDTLNRHAQLSAGGAHLLAEMSAHVKT